MTTTMVLMIGQIRVAEMLNLRGGGVQETNAEDVVPNRLRTISFFRYCSHHYSISTLRFDSLVQRLHQFRDDAAFLLEDLEPGVIRRVRDGGIIYGSPSWKGNTVHQQPNNVQCFVPNTNTPRRVINLNQRVDSTILIKQICRILCASRPLQIQTIVDESEDQLQEDHASVHGCRLRRFQIVHDDVEPNGVDDRLADLGIYK